MYQVEAGAILYKMAGTKCGQATSGEKYASVASSFAGLPEGACVAQGYTVPSGDRVLNLALVSARQDGHVWQNGAEGLRHKRDVAAFCRAALG